VTIKYGCVMMRLILAYFPPRPRDSKQEPQWRATCKALRAWVFHQWDQAKEKETPFIMTDLNSQLEHTYEHQRLIGPFGCGRANECGDAFTQDLLLRKAAAINTHFDAGCTYIDRYKKGKTIDFIFAPVVAMGNIADCRTWRRRTRSVAASAHVTDHIAVVATIFLGQVSQGSYFQHPLWDRNKLAGELRAATGLATMAVGYITEAKQANKLIEDGTCDITLLGRQLLRDPYWPTHAAQILGDDPKPHMPLQYHVVAG
jgi:hypothetical protein